MFKIISYTRDHTSGKVVKRNLKDIANTITTFTGRGWTTEQYVLCMEQETFKPPAVLRMERTEEEKRRRTKEGDAGAKFSAAKHYAPRTDGISNTVTTNTKDNMLIDNQQPKKRLRIRKLTEREVFRLMNVSETDIDKIQAAGISKTQQYKMAGNSICVGVLYHIFRKMFIQPECEHQQRTLF